MEQVNFLHIGDQLCTKGIESFLSKGHSCKLWVYSADVSPVPEEVDIGNAADIEPLDPSIRVHHFADYWRLKMLFKCGGWWSDLDNFCMKSLNEIADDYFFQHIENGIIKNNIIKAPKGSEFLKSCLLSAAEINWKERMMGALTHRFLMGEIAKFNLGRFIHTKEEVKLFINHKFQ